MTQSLTIQHLPPEAIHKLKDDFPDYVKKALMEKAENLNCPLEAVIEMARSSRYPQGVATFLDDEAFSFEDCLLPQRLKDSA